MVSAESLQNFHEKVETEGMLCMRSKTTELLDYANENRQNGRFSDVSLIVEDQTIRANRMVLSCYCQYFDRMFTTEMREKYQDDIVLNGITKESMELLIEFIYTGRIVIKKENVCNLLSASDMLGVPDVRESCLEFLECSINSQTALFLLSLADLYRSEDVKQRAFDFIEEHLEEIILSDEFKKLEMDKMCLFVNEYKASQMTTFKAFTSWIREDYSNRREHFSTLFCSLELNKMPRDFLEDVVSCEELVQEHFECVKLLSKTLVEKSKRGRNLGCEGKIIAIGGSRTMKEVREVFNDFSGGNAKYPSLPDGKYAASAVYVHPRLFVIGGSKEDEDIAAANNEVLFMDFSKSELKWHEASPMKDQRLMTATAVLYGTIFTVGGLDGFGNSLSSGECYSLAFNKWDEIKPMEERRNGHALVTCRGDLYAIGGCNDGTYLNSVERLRPNKMTWDVVSPMDTPRRWLAAVVMEDRYIYAIGGCSGSDRETNLKRVEKYDVDIGKWSNVCPMLTARSAHTANVLHGKIYVVGGVDENIEVATAIDCYDPAVDKWTTVGESKIKLFHHALAVV
ncbi:kelch-like protein 36 isoform X1 [Clavelina lepadiformis]|uniref:kelch-like protein 36 isoform X1 n=1 Tax=Clavelina lepadiformis TaxID=159417 RepID=UPI004041B3BF